MNNESPSGSKKVRSIKPKSQSKFPLTPTFFIVLAVVLVCGLLLINPLSQLSESAAENAALREQLIEMQDEAELAKLELAKWNDRGYVISQARNDLGYVAKGEIKIYLIGSVEKLLEQAKPDATDTAEILLAPTWYQKLLSSFN